MSHLLCVMRAISNFKSLLSTRSRQNSPRLTLSPSDADPSNSNNDGQATRWTRHRPTKPSLDEQELAALKRDNEAHATRLLEERTRVLKQRGGADKTGRHHRGWGGLEMHESPGGYDSDKNHHHHYHHPDGGAPQAAPPPVLGIGAGGADNYNNGEQQHDLSDEPAPIVVDSPTGVDFNVYDRAYEEEVERIKRSGEAGSNVYMTWHLDSKDRSRGDGGGEGEGEGEGDVDGNKDGDLQQQKPGRFADLVAQAIRDTRAKAQEGGLEDEEKEGGES